MEQINLTELFGSIISDHFQDKVDKKDVLDELKTNENDVLKTMTALKKKAGKKSSTTESNLVCAMKMHFGDDFDDNEIKECLKENNGDILRSMKNLNERKRKEMRPKL